MSVRRTSVKLGLAAVAVSSLALTVLAPANADTTPTGGVNLGTTLIGAGSDTTQWVMDRLTTDYDATNPAAPVANYDACLGDTQPGANGLGDNPDGSGFPCGADNTGTQLHARDAGIVDSAAAGATLPNSSGSGRSVLFTPGADGSNTRALFDDVAFARSSGPIDSAAQGAGLEALPFAVDKIVVATHPGGPAPASLSGQQVLKIFNGTYKNWDQVGGKNAPIHPYMPKSGSSTLNAFMSFLAALDGTTEAPGTDSDPGSHSAAKQAWQGPGKVTTSNWNTGGIPVEEHDPSVIINDPNAIEPFSYGRAQLANGQSQTVRIEGGWSADRELYNVVRTKAISGVDSTPFLYGSDGNALESVFSNTGWICTNATAQGDINNAGFWPLKSGTATGDCGVPNTNTLDTIPANGGAGDGEGAPTTTNAVLSGNTVHVTVVAANGTTPTGTVQLVANGPSVGVNVPAASFATTVTLSGGSATVTVPTSAAGQKTFEVSYLPAGFGAKSSAGGHTALGSSYTEFRGVVPGAAATTTSLSMANSVYGRAATVSATVRAGSRAATSGTVTFRIGGIVRLVAVRSGVARTSLPKTQRPGSYRVSASYTGNTAFKSSASTARTLVIRKAGAKLSESFAASVRKHKAIKGVVKVKITGGTATGTVEIKLGNKVVAKGKLHGGKVTLNIHAGKLGKKGKKHLTIAYLGSADVNKAKKAFTIKQN